MIYHVSEKAIKIGNGSVERPFQSIQEAADVALPGDEIVVAPGIYREHVKPRHSGTPDQPIHYRSEITGMAVITGAEPIRSWERHGGDVWMARVPNGLFGSYNPYATVLEGDWYFTKEARHTGEVYLNGKSLFEANSLEEVVGAAAGTVSSESGTSGFNTAVPVATPDGVTSVRLLWHAVQEAAHTVLYVNFRGKDPREENVEINVRRNCFFAEKTGIDCITVSGFVIRQAATTWAPPTAFQDGMIGPHWAKGWVIEDCEICDSKCVGIVIGKHLQPDNENKWTHRRLKHGTQTERDAICQAQLEGWTKERVGSHIIRRCDIHDCEQAGIVGHLGCAFSIIEDCHIHHINQKHQMMGAEIAGVKLHAAIDVQFRRNHVHHCTRGLWLDWQAQGTRVERNLFHDNFPASVDEKIGFALDIGEDLFVEVSHGPTLVDHNLLLSPQACRIATQGMAFVHNLICGSFTCVGEGTNNVFNIETLQKSGVQVTDAGPRYTPYHVPHRTEVVGFMTILHGDDRFYNNIFVQKTEPHQYDALYERLSVKPANSVVGTAPFSPYPLAEEYFPRFFLESDKGLGEDRSKYYTKLPVYTGGNVFFNGAEPSGKEQNFVVDREHAVRVGLRTEGEAIFLDTNLGEFLPAFETPFISTEFLGEAFEPEQLFENPDGSPILFNRDYFGIPRGVNPAAGPFETLEGWGMRIR